MVHLQLPQRAGAAAYDVAFRGVSDGPIEIVDYDPSWPSCFAAERERLAPVLPGIAIHHIGSTAVPGLAAKSVIDMIALVDDLDAGVAIVTQRAGYVLPARFNVNLRHRRFLCYPSACFRTHHLHLVDEREGMERCLRFRDSLRGDALLCAEYAALKRVLAVRFGDDREAYTQAKTAFINLQIGVVDLEADRPPHRLASSSTGRRAWTRAAAPQRRAS